MAYTPFEFPLPMSKVVQRRGFDGDHELISQDQSVFREGSHSMLIAGSATATIWGVCGSQPVMKYWSHNTGVDQMGRFLPRDEADSCSLIAICEDNTIRYFGAPSAARATLPVWTEFLRIDILTGKVTYQSAGLVINNPANTFSYTLTSAAIVANRVLNLPLTTATDTLMCLGLAQTVTGILTLTTPVIGAATGTSAVLTGAITSSGTAGIGYATGAGGAVVQATSKVTAFTLSKTVGTITFAADALAADTSSAGATWTNTTIAANDVVNFTHSSGGTMGAYNVACTPAAGSATIFIRNMTPGSLSEAPVFRFTVIKGVVA